MPVRVRRRHGLTATILGGIALLALAVGPVMADAEMGHTGTVGFHKLRDSGYTNAGAECRYKGIYPSPGGYSYEGKLKYITVRPPKMKAVPGGGSQEVGWQFKAQRAVDDVVGAWTTRYTSGIQRRMTTPSRLADFTDQGVKVRVPTSSADDPSHYVYRVLVRMLWYHEDGTVQGKATHLVQYYSEEYRNWPLGDGTEESATDTSCTGWVAIDIN